MTDKERIEELLILQNQLLTRVSEEITEVLRGNPHSAEQIKETLQFVLDDRFYHMNNKE